MDADVDRIIAKVNNRLKTARIKLKLERRENWLWARGTLPPKLHLDKQRTKPYQQRFALNCPATTSGIAQGERLCRLAASKLALGQFNWDEWSNIPSEYPTTIGEWLERFERDFWIEHGTSTRAQNNWKTYTQVFAKLPRHEPLSQDILINVLAKIENNTRARQKAARVLAALAKKAELPNEAIAALGGQYSPKSVEPRDLPSDPVIAVAYDMIANPSWKWVFGIMATYGLRNHEVFHLNLEDFPTVWVEDPTKTGKRFVYPVYREWAERWQLRDRLLPNFKELSKSNKFDWDNSKLGAKISKRFSAMNIGFTPYDLRHCYNRRCFEHGMSAEMAAKLMGHSLQVQLTVYRAWWGEAPYRNLYEAIQQLPAP